VPRHLAHIHAILDLGYPFKEEVGARLLVYVLASH
jgi:hypothetical protein